MDVPEGPVVVVVPAEVVERAGGYRSCPSRPSTPVCKEPEVEQPGDASGRRRRGCPEVASVLPLAVHATPTSSSVTVSGLLTRQEVHVVERLEVLGHAVGGVVVAADHEDADPLSRRRVIWAEKKSPVL